MPLVATRTPSDRLELHKALRLLHGDPDEPSVDTDIDWSRVRDLTHHPLREALARGDVQAFVMEETGQQHSIPRWLWDGAGLWGHAYDSHLVKVPFGAGPVSGYLLVDTQGFDRLLGRSAKTVTPEDLAYMPPYVAYLLEVADRFDLTADYRFDHDLMAKWIEANPPPGVKISGTKSGYLATILTHPDFEGGGQPGHAVAGKRSPNPCATFKGISYPRPRRH